MVDEDVYQKVLKLTNDLAAQQQSNQALASGIKSQLVELKQRAANSALEREQSSSNAMEQQLLLNAQDISEDSIQGNYVKLLQEHQNTVRQNQQLEKQCKDLQKLVKEYELALEHVATKLRAHTISATEGQVQLRREFEALLDAEKSTTAELMVENITLRQHLHRLGGLLREAYNQDNADDYTTQLAQLTMENQGLRDMLKISTVALDSLPPPAKSDKTEAVKSHGQSGVVEEFFSDNT